ncbi:MAG: lipase family protein [Frankia sp.]
MRGTADRVRMRRGFLIAVLAAGLVATGCSGASSPAGRLPGPAATHATPKPDSTTTAGPFYQPPAPLPPARPGTLIRDQGVITQAGQQAWRILYHSRGPTGADIAVSGIVVAPAGAAPVGGRRVIVYGHGTTGIADRCAPSSWSNPLTAIIDSPQLLGAGYVVVATDYPGLGTLGTHPLYVAGGEGRAMLDAARAARSLPGVGAGAETVVVGYSQGGQAALAAGAMAATYAPDLHVHGIFAAAPLIDVPATLRSMDVSSGPGYTLLAALGVAAIDSRADIDTVLTATGRSLARAATVECSGTLVEKAAALGFSRIFSADPMTTSPFREDFAAQAAVTERPGMPPLNLVQGTADVTVPPPATAAAVRRLCALHDTVRYTTYPAADHATVISASITGMMGWIADRFDDRRAPTSCPRSVIAR